MQNKKMFLFILVGFAIVTSAVIFMLYPKKNDIPPISDNEKSGATSPKNATYIIDSKKVTLKNGLSETSFEPGSATKIVTKYFGNEINPDLDKDGRPDSVFLITQNLGGSGTFYFVVAALNKESGYVGTDAVLLGDRISPQTIEMSREVGKERIIIVNYADRYIDDSFSTPPSLGKSIWLLLDTKTMQFGEVAQNFEGESN